MTEPRLILCGGLGPGRRARPSVEPLELAIGRGPRDVRLRLNQFSAQMRAALTPVAADLIEVAAYVYVADQAVPRGGLKQFDYGDRWHRHLRFRVPVRRADVWNQPAVRDELTHLLRFLTDDDEFEFEFVPTRRAIGLDRYLFDEVAPEQGSRFEEVALFSGGLDSLCGAVDEVHGGQRRVLLYSHRPENRLYARQRDLVAAICGRLADPRLAPFHFAATVTKGKVHNRDFMQRSRSFLFGAMAAVTARLFGLRRIRFYENGVTSLNLPISPQVIGGRASRTTHPQTLSRMARLLSLLFETEFAVENPYQWLTKPQILQRLAGHRHADLCAATSSCIHTWTRTSDHPHCGRCSQCVDRRVSVLAAGLDNTHDPASGYESDVLAGERAGAEMTLVERYIGSANDTGRIPTAREFAARYPEIAQIIPYTGLPADRTVQNVFDLYHQHALEVERAIQSANEPHSDATSFRPAPPHSLLGIVNGRDSHASRVGAVRPPSSSEEAGGLSGSFVVDHSRFEVRFGDAVCFLGNGREFHLVDRLFRAGDQFVTVKKLQDDVWNDTQVEKNTVQRTVSNVRRRFHEAGFVGVVLDGKQRDNYRLVYPRS